MTVQQGRPCQVIPPRTSCCYLSSHASSKTQGVPRQNFGGADAPAAPPSSAAPGVHVWVCVCSSDVRAHACACGSNKTYTSSVSRDKSHQAALNHFLRHSATLLRHFPQAALGHSAIDSPPVAKVCIIPQTSFECRALSSHSAPPVLRCSHISSLDHISRINLIYSFSKQFTPYETCFFFFGDNFSLFASITFKHRHCVQTSNVCCC